MRWTDEELHAFREEPHSAINASTAIIKKDAPDCSPWIAGMSGRQ
jgi:hypothetical protein